MQVRPKDRNPKYCKELVNNPHRFFPAYVQCSESPQKDGWCKYHHPIEKTKRRRTRKERKIKILISRGKLTIPEFKKRLIRNIQRFPGSGTTGDFLHKDKICNLIRRQE